MAWQPIEHEEAQEQIGQGIHTGLRKGSDAPSSGPLWRAISDSHDGAWGDALRFCVWGLESMGYRLCKQVPDQERPAPPEPTGHVWVNGYWRRHGR